MKKSMLLLGFVFGTVLFHAESVLAQGVRPAAGLSQTQYMNNLLNAQGASWGVGRNAAWGNMMNPYMPGAGAWGGAANPYLPGGGGWGGEPYGGVGGLGGYGGWPFEQIPPAGFFLMGAADVMKAYGSVITSAEQARIMREQYYQSRIDTAKKRFEYELYVKANTPSFTDEQVKIAKNTLKRVQMTNNPTEISTGKSLNILLDDLRRTTGKKISSDPIPLGEDVLRHLNVTSDKSAGRNLGILRNDGRFTWPPALQEILPQKQREEIEVQAQAVVQKASNGAPPGNLLIELQNAIDKTRDTLVAKINDLPTSQFIDAKRFLNDFDDARRALQAGDAIRYFEFQKWATSGGSGKSIQEVVEYLSSKGLSIAPAVQGDEAAYQAVHSALAAYDIAFNTQFASAKE
ncbi:MAG: hypothetical protein FJ271_19220 [Planctomycetes bacterium]|nr:hypothetical protein [Planctomycetota bacterium]